MQNNEINYIEELCMKLYTSNNASIANAAQAELMKITSTPDFIPKCQYNNYIIRTILNVSKNSYALTLAANGLTHLITSNWNSFTPEQKQDIRII